MPEIARAGLGEARRQKLQVGSHTGGRTQGEGPASPHLVYLSENKSGTRANLTKPGTGMQD